MWSASDKHRHSNLLLKYIVFSIQEIYLICVELMQIIYRINKTCLTSIYDYLEKQTDDLGWSIQTSLFICMIT